MKDTDEKTTRQRESSFSLPTSIADQVSRFPKRERVVSLPRLCGIGLLLVLVTFGRHLWPANSARRVSERPYNIYENLCPQVSAITPKTHESLLETLDAQFVTEEYKLKAYESLGGAVRIPTQTFDDLKPPGEDPRWDIHLKFQAYLEARFPKVHGSLKRTKINTYALVYHWQGSDASLKPLLLAAHSDVVPVNPTTSDNWVNPPFSGYFDGEYIWGRGSCDDKSGLIGSLVSVETLLEQGFQPARSVVLAFGIDEERGGISGATAIRDYLLEVYGEDSFSMLVDEGGGYSDIHGTIFASPSVAEKGKMDIRIDVSTPGGHSSRPPKHTGIGILANIITELEAHPHEPQLFRDRTYYQSLQCRAEYDKSLSPSLRDLIIESRDNDEALQELEATLLEVEPSYYAVAGTTQAVDLIGGGVKINALPEAVWSVVNHRLADHSSISALKERFAGVVNPVAHKYNMSLDAFGQHLGLDNAAAYGHVRLSDAFGTALEPAPVTPTKRSGPYELLSGTIVSTLESSLRTYYANKSVVVSPGLSLGNTDTRHYWKLTRHIFRYNHRGAADGCNGVHTVNEAIKGEGFLEMIRFFTRLILNADETDLLE